MDKSLKGTTEDTNVLHTENGRQEELERPNVIRVKKLGCYSIFPTLYKLIKHIERQKR